MTVNKTVPQKDEPKALLIEIAARLTDYEARDGTTADWLRAFRKNYRHMAVTFGLTFEYLDLARAERATEQDLDVKATQEAA